MRKVRHLEAVTVCVNYADFLKVVAPFNQHLFERWVIVTEPTDEHTREVCRRFNLQCILSEDGRRHGEDFNKGRMVERGAQHLSKDCHRLHIDSDIVLPSNFRQSLERADIQEDTIYGVDRLMVQSYEEWLELKHSGYLNDQLDYHCRLRFPMRWKLGARWAHPEMGYVPIGFFQLWHSSQDDWRGVRVKPYPTHHGNATRTDVQHGLQWDRHKRALIPEIVAVHLESEPTEMGKNWKGRKTKPFGPTAVSDRAMASAASSPEDKAEAPSVPFAPKPKEDPVKKKI
jgi:hypothetical protein